MDHFVNHVTDGARKKGQCQVAEAIWYSLSSELKLSSELLYNSGFWPSKTSTNRNESSHKSEFSFHNARLISKSTFPNFQIVNSYLVFEVLTGMAAPATLLPRVAEGSDLREGGGDSGKSNSPSH